MARAQGEAGSGRQAGDAGSEAARGRRHDDTALSGAEQHESGHQGAHPNTEEHCRTVSSPTTPSKLDPHFPYVYWPTPGGDSALSVDRTIPMLLVVTDGQSRAQIYFGTQFRAPRAASGELKAGARGATISL